MPLHPISKLHQPTPLKGTEGTSWLGLKPVCLARDPQRLLAMWHVFIQSFDGHHYGDVDVDGTLLALAFAHCLAHTTPTFSLTL
jgi:hypothetical protein